MNWNKSIFFVEIALWSLEKVNITNSDECHNAYKNTKLRVG